MDQMFKDKDFMQQMDKLMSQFKTTDQPKKKEE